MKSKNSKIKTTEEQISEISIAKRSNKQQTVIEMLKSKDGACLEELIEATGWQKHSIRGLIAGSLKKKLGLIIKSEIRLNTRVYFIESEEIREGAV